ncbi:bactofilin family protein [Pseudoalteromonas denitrificans]|uniref:Protein CcmA, bactofilin family n=1 Tax=Pseudoalteromonas denitrificans DSM 6059 TaxID=1123010 RepID=A0A1I1MKK0_9GAMM|nr:polymer-forming cytoskeletal protein [Pseudoalteromonas denitrificans]SFC85352.1 protein CcmA, bactofilin family [Pseudoalteromonas denitrificans DSM 6059]
MFSKNKDHNKPAPIDKNATPSIIGTDVVIQGNVSSQGLIQLDGKIEGEISINSLTVGEKGWIDGAIEAQEVTVKGKVTGSISAINVILEKTAYVKGDIRHKTISIETGANIDASIKQVSEDMNVTEIKSKKSSDKKTG